MAMMDRLYGYAKYSSDLRLQWLTGAEDGFYTEEEGPVVEAGPRQKQRVLKKIPEKVIQNAVGLAIFTTMRTGLWVSGAGGSGVLVARTEDGSWSPPSGIMLHTAGLGFLVGVDIYDCVLVINDRKALGAFTKIRATLGGEISAVAGPVGAGGVLENDGKWKQINKPVFTYLKSRGFYAGIQVDGTIIIERTDENARFYRQTIGVADILAGKIRHPPPELKMLMETLKAAEGRTDVDAKLMGELDGQPTPGDVDVDAPSDSKIFGIPESDDLDPFGVHALEREGLEIREAATRSRPSSQQFEYNPSPTSPIYNIFHRRSMSGTRSNWENIPAAHAPPPKGPPPPLPPRNIIQPIIMAESEKDGLTEAERKDGEEISSTVLPPESNVEKADETRDKISDAASEPTDAKADERTDKINDAASSATDAKPDEKRDKINDSESEPADAKGIDKENDDVLVSNGSSDYATGSNSPSPKPTAWDEEADKFHSVPGSPNKFE